MDKASIQKIVHQLQGTLYNICKNDDDLAYLEFTLSYASLWLFFDNVDQAKKYLRIFNCLLQQNEADKITCTFRKTMRCVHSCPHAAEYVEDYQVRSQLVLEL